MKTITGKKKKITEKKGKGRLYVCVDLEPLTLRSGRPSTRHPDLRDSGRREVEGWKGGRGGGWGREGWEEDTWKGWRGKRKGSGEGME